MSEWKEQVALVVPAYQDPSGELSDSDLESVAGGVLSLADKQAIKKLIPVANVVPISNILPPKPKPRM